MKSAFSKTFFPVLLILLTALVAVGISFQIFVRNVLKEQIMEDMESNADALCQLAHAYSSDGSFINEDFVVNLSISNRISRVDTVVCGTDGQLLLCSDSPLGCDHQGLVISDDYLQKILASGSVHSTGLIQGLYPEARYVISKVITDLHGDAIGILIVSSPISQTDSILNKMAEIYTVISFLVVLAVILITSIYLRRQNAPLRTMAKVARDFGHGKLDARVRVEDFSSEEIQDLALAFNNMASSLQKSEYQRQEFVANVSHELKTPMTTISGFVDGILDGTIPPERQQYYMELVSKETKRLSRLVRSMLDISRLQDQGGIPDDKKTRFDLTETLGQVLITFEQQITKKHLQVQVDMPDHPVFTRAAQDAITQVIYNLTDNAVKFCPDGGNIGLQLRLGSGKVYVSIRNDGNTIPPEELPLMFDRFHKLDKSRSENRDGWGLGLYIVKTIIDSHSENISVTSQNGVTEFTFTLPLVN